jgi:hypothetical protein
MEWMFKLEGNISFLEELSKYFSSSELLIFKEKDNIYYLKSTYFNNLNNEYEARNKAEHLITLINGATELILYRKKPIERINLAIKINDNGSKSFSYSIPCTANIIPKMTKSTIDERKKLLKEWVIASLKDDIIATLFEFICSDSYKWYLLYKRLELVQVNLGGETELINRKWVPESEIKLFKHTANCYKAIGIEARHYNSNKRPSNPMTYSDAKKLIEKINLKWLEERSK